MPDASRITIESKRERGGLGIAGRDLAVDYFGVVDELRDHRERFINPERINEF